MHWKLFDGEKEEWNKIILDSKAHYRQSYNWGEYKSLMSKKILPQSLKKLRTQIINLYLILQIFIKTRMNMIKQLKIIH